VKIESGADAVGLVFLGMRDELIRLDADVATIAPVIHMPALWKQSQWRLGQMEDRRAVGDGAGWVGRRFGHDPATARRVASARAR
jgi:hypothetical protein